MMATFDYAFSIVLELEGGLSNDKDDPGGLTKYGISTRALPDADITELTGDQVRRIYFKKYWLPAKCDALPTGIDLYHFVFAVNAGIIRAGKFLQRSVNMFIKQKLTVDGIVGPKTIRAIMPLDTRELLIEYNAKVTTFYARLAIAKKPLRKFLYGWERRASIAFERSLKIG